MKGKKLISLLLAAAITVAMSVGALAGEFALPAESHLDEGVMKIWMTDGTDGNTTGVKGADFAPATHIEITFNKVPDAGAIDMAWLGDANGWGWKQTNIPVTAATVLIETKNLEQWATVAGGDQLKFFVFDDANEWEDGALKITSIKLVGDYPEAAAATAAADPAPAASSPKTGDNNMIYLFTVLFLGAAAGLVSVRVLKRQKSN